MHVLSFVCIFVYINKIKNTYITFDCQGWAEKSSFSYEFTWVGTAPAEMDMIETKIKQQISLYPGIEYDNITLSTSGGDGRLRIHAIADSSDVKPCSVQ